LDGVTQDVKVLSRQVTPDPNATGISYFGGNCVAKVYAGQVNYTTEDQNWMRKKATNKLSRRYHDCVFG